MKIENIECLIIAIMLGLIFILWFLKAITITEVNTLDEMPSVYDLIFGVEIEINGYLNYEIDYQIRGMKWVFVFHLVAFVLASLLTFEFSDEYRGCQIALFTLLIFAGVGFFVMMYSGITGFASALQLKAENVKVGFAIWSSLIMYVFTVGIALYQLTKKIDVLYFEIKGVIRNIF